MSTYLQIQLKSVSTFIWCHIERKWQTKFQHKDSKSWILPCLMTPNCYLNFWDNSPRIWCTDSDSTNWEELQKSNECSEGEVNGMKNNRLKNCYFQIHNSPPSFPQPELVLIFQWYGKLVNIVLLPCSYPTVQFKVINVTLEIRTSCIVLLVQ